MKNKYILYSLLFLGSLTFHSFADHHDHYNFEEEHATDVKRVKKMLRFRSLNQKQKKITQRIPLPQILFLDL